ncbi:hypothetical protein P3X46_025481 [Hevea brasiliensis]|uniref:DUF674 domain-containing protein n=1 Tax=Hevea brasiliensis TaxID=3981 RepID=A0ABQ9L5Q8_HEVBR|nr:uncharacterized protein LOC110660228 [Hevea brasiliensis]XP_057989516.1 uncharacterized protein LOC110660228 [Hevea brasiliensis]KAJ9160042.1 hypothetical protein P3X46_025481 [Hevea brasiliensis]
MAAENKVSLKLLIDKKANRVLFAEAGKDFVDFLFALLSLPVGAIIRLLKKPAMVGCIGNLHESLENLDEAYMQPYQSKDSLLKPTVPLSQLANMPLLLPDTDHLQPGARRKVYGCSNHHHRCVTDRKDAPCSYCNAPMTFEPRFIVINDNNTASGSEGGFVKGLVTYMVTDDLSVSPMSMISGVALLNKFSVNGFSALNEKTVQFGIDEGLELLKASLQSKAALTTVFLAKDEIKDAAAPK